MSVTDDRKKRRSLGGDIAGGASSSDAPSEESTTSAILTGSLRGMLLVFLKKSYWTTVFKKKAFLQIGKVSEKQKEGKSVQAAVRTTSKHPLHSKIQVTAEGVFLGVVVFGTYDTIIKRWARKHEKDEDISRSLLLDFGAGAAAGFAQSISRILWEEVVYKSNFLREHPQFCVRTIVHNSLGYGALFGSYRGIREALIRYSSYETFEYSLGRVLPVENTPKGSLCTFVAGGLAGQIHHVLNHYTHHWRSFSAGKMSRPRIRPMINAFLPTALCFFAFEHGAAGCNQMFDLAEHTIGVKLEQLASKS